MSIEIRGCKQWSQFTDTNFLHQTLHKSKMHPDERQVMPCTGDLALRLGGLLCGHKSFQLPSNICSHPETSSHEDIFCLSSFFICYRTWVSAKPQTTKKKVSLIKYTTVLLLCLKKHAHFKANHGRRHTGEPLENIYFTLGASTLRTPALVRLNPS